MKNLYSVLLSVLLLLFAQPAAACITCNKKIQQAIFDSAFYPNLLAMLSPFIVLAGIVVALAKVSNNRYNASVSSGDNRSQHNSIPLTTAALVLGIGLGGFADGILLHQILQWHEMLSNKLPPTDLVNKSVNMFWDGIFHFFCFLVVLAGVVMLWKAGRRPGANLTGKLLSGGLLAGWGVFNIIEGLMDHHVLKLHNVREVTENVPAWNWGFLGFSVLLLLAGWSLIRKGAR